MPHARGCTGCIESRSCHRQRSHRGSRPSGWRTMAVSSRPLGALAVTMAHGRSDEPHHSDSILQAPLGFGGCYLTAGQQNGRAGREAFESNYRATNSRQLLDAHLYAVPGNECGRRSRWRPAITHLKSWRCSTATAGSLSGSDALALRYPLATSTSIEGTRCWSRARESTARERQLTYQQHRLLHVRYHQYPCLPMAPSLVNFHRRSRALECNAPDSNTALPLPEAFRASCLVAAIPR